jgi:hypothetical protein
MSLKQLVNSHDVYQSFLEYVQKKIDLHQRSLEVATDIVDIHRLQGQIIALRRLLSLRDEVNSMDK